MFNQELATGSAFQTDILTRPPVSKQRRFPDVPLHRASGRSGETPNASRDLIVLL
jgi:hypothetical protein